MESELSNKIEELQSLEQNIQTFLMQKQTAQLELNEILNALDELSRSDDEVYKIVSGLMVKAKKPEVVKELEEKKKILDLRISSVEKHESNLSEKIEKLREEISKTMNSSKK